MKKLIIIYISLLCNLLSYAQDVVTLSSTYQGSSVVACSQISLLPGFSYKAAPYNSSVSFKVSPTTCTPKTVEIEGISSDNRFDFGVLNKAEHTIFNHNYMWKEYHPHYIKDNKLTFYARVTLERRYTLDAYVESDANNGNATASWTIHDSNNKQVYSDSYDGCLSGGPTLDPGTYYFTISVSPFVASNDLKWDILFQQSGSVVSGIPTPSPNPTPTLKGTSADNRFDFGTHEEDQFNIGHYDYFWKGYKSYFIKNNMMSFYGKITLNKTYVIAEYLDILAFYNTKTKVCWDVYDIDGNLISPSCNDEGLLTNTNLTLQPGTYYFNISMGTFTSADGWYWNSYFNWNFGFKVKTSPTVTTLANPNYIKTSQPRVAMATIASTASYSDVTRTYKYFDGLGRPMQTVARNASPSGKDLITVQEYDTYGRESISWLPVPYSASGNAVSSSIADKVREFHGSDKPYSKSVYEKSPLNRPVQQFGPGDIWHNNKIAVSTEYLGNTASGELACLIFTVNTSGVLSKGGSFAANYLFVTKVTDEGGSVSYQFKNKLGQVILTRQMDGTTQFDTYFAYDIYGNLAYVIPPEGVDKITNFAETNDLMKQYAYIYKYDKFKRCIYKKIPGCEPIYYIYDKADRLIFTQDGEQRANNQWLFTIPDALGRPVLTGICKNTLSYTANPLGSVVVSAKRSDATNTYKGYATPTGVTLTSPSILSVNYYDDYAFLGYNGVPNTADSQYTTETGYGACYGDHQAANKIKSKGLLTGTLVGQMQADGTISSTYLYAVLYYDNRGRIVQTKSNNHLTGGVEKEYVAYDFTGQPVKKQHIHSATGKTTLKEDYVYTYDHAGRLLKTTHQLTEGTIVKPQIVLALNTYDDLGRLKTNMPNSQENLKTTYTYNVRSWTDLIVSTNFWEKLTYSYSGNINTQEWGQAAKTRKYAFVYDNLSRLKTATFANATATNEKFGASYTYDKQGNIKTLTRNGLTASSTYGVIDNLTMYYSGNQMIAVADAAANIALAASADFKEYSKVTSGEYSYNANGAMIQDKNKGITRITYNALNLPLITDIKSPIAEARNEYTYTATGSKLKVVQKWNPDFSTAPVIGSDINVQSLTRSKTTDYVANKVYEDGTLKRILTDNGYYESGIYYFYIKDHLGNNRIVSNQTSGVVQSTQYYPFGMAFADGTDATAQPYKYNGKELDPMHGLNQYDYSARYYDPAFARFTSVDPLAEKYYSWSPYAYVANNPLKFIDPTGMELLLFFNGVYVGSHDDGKEEIRGFNQRTTTKEDGSQEYAGADSFSFNDIELDRDALVERKMTLNFMSNSDVDNIIDASGVKNQDMNSRWGYATDQSNASSVTGGKMDYRIYLPGNINKTLFVVNGIGYNGADMGNYLWGYGMRTMGFTTLTARAAAHINAWWSAKQSNGDGSQNPNKFLKWFEDRSWKGDSTADQRAIKKGMEDAGSVWKHRNKTETIKKLLWNKF